MKRVLVLLGLVGALALPLASAAADSPVVHFGQRATLGFYRGMNVEYLDFGSVKLAPGNKTAPIWVVTNGAAGQRNIIDTVQGRAGYSPLWTVNLITWNDGSSARVLTSAAAVKKAAAAGELTVKSAPVVVNCPVL